MARAKTTDRAEARRRYRAQLAAEAEAEAAAADAAGMPWGESTEPPVPNRLSRGAAIANRLGVGRVVAAPQPPSEIQARPQAGPARAQAGPGRTQTAVSAPAQTGRVGIVDSFRLASSPANLRADVEAFPSIARHSNAVWLPVAIVIATGLAYLVPTLRQNTIVVFLVQALLAPPAMIPSFLAGMLTRRASWLAGAVAGLASSVMAILVILTVPLSGATQVTTSASDALWIIVVGPLFGAGVGAFAGFYRRFLAFSSPNRPQQTRRKGAAKRR